MPMCGHADVQIVLRDERVVLGPLHGSRRSLSVLTVTPDSRRNYLFSSMKAAISSHPWITHW